MWRAASTLLDDRPGLRRRHRWRHVRPCAAGARSRRRPGGRRPRCQPPSGTSAPGAASRRACCRTRPTRTSSSTSSACSGASPGPIWDSSPRWCAAPGRPSGCCASGSHESSCRSAATRACRRSSPPGGSRFPVVVVSYDRTPGPSEPVVGPVGSGLRRCLRELAAAASGDDRRTRPAGDPRCRPVIGLAAASAHAALLGIDPDRFMVAVMGGSLGSGVLNDAIAGHLAAHRDDEQLAVRQITGERFVERGRPTSTAPWSTRWSATRPTWQPSTRPAT